MTRSGLALGTLLTLLLSSPDILFSRAQGIAEGPHCSPSNTFTIFCLGWSLNVARWVAILVLLLVIVGWRPRLTGLLHWWVSYGLYSAGTLVDGGDQITSILTLLLIPMTVIDPRPSHWSPPPTDLHPRALLAAHSVIVVIRLQIFVIYFQSAVAKLGVIEWVDGTALYYWLRDPSFGAASWLRPLTDVVVTNALGVTLITWGTILIELVLAASFLLPAQTRKTVLPLGLLLHLAIALLMGISSFSIAMMSALLLYLWPIGMDMHWPRRMQAKKVSQSLTLQRYPEAAVATPLGRRHAK